MKVYSLILVACLMLTGCGKKEYFVENTDNPPYKPNIEFQGFEDLSHPGFQHLIEKYQLTQYFMERQMSSKGSYC
jgi:hypothetical protein